MSRSLLLLTTALLGLSAASAYAQAATPVSPVSSGPLQSTAAPVEPKAYSDSEKAGIEQVIKDYLTKEHPEVLIEAMQELQIRQQASAQAKSEEALKKDFDQIFNDPATPVGGNPKGSVTIVEFFDFNCGYCKMSEPFLEKILKEDHDIKMIYKDYPILGPTSVEAAKAALASVKQNAYVKFHDALMSQKDHLSSDAIYSIAKDIGLNVEKLKKDMTADEIAAHIKANEDLGREVGVRGTPMFIIGNQIFPGALQYEQMKSAVDKAHEDTKNKK